jgi:hypothetical protein
MRAGVHLANNGNVTDEHLKLISDLRLVKGLVRLDCDWDEIDYRRLAPHLLSDCVIVLRLFFPGRLPPDEFVRRATYKLPPVLAALSSHETFIEIHNEPNHRDGIEGWGKSEEQAGQFSIWYALVLRMLRQQGFSNLGFPGLALGEWSHGERTWARANEANIRRSDWLGVHCYWQTPDQIEHPQLGANWRFYRREFPHKQLIVTEAANSGCHGAMGPPLPEQQATQYSKWCRLATNEVWGVAFYILGGTQDWQGFQIHPETIRVLNSIA